MATAAILTIGNEVLSGDTLNTNAAWLAQRLERLGVHVRHTTVLPDEIDEIAAFVRERAPAVDFLIVTGGLGGTPDDLTRESIAAAFGLEQEEVPEVAADLRARFTRDPEYAARWAQLPRARGRSRIPVEVRRGSSSRTSTSFRGFPPRWRRCSTDRGRVPRRAADRRVATQISDARERDRGHARRGR